jgi:hypothetical protein
MQKCALIYLEEVPLQMAPRTWQWWNIELALSVEQSFVIPENVTLIDFQSPTNRTD